MMMNAPINSTARLVTVVIPSYKGANFLGEAIESCLRQTHRELEIIVVDDASPDNCAEIGERYARQDSRVRVIRHAKNGGVSRAFNTGFNAGRGNFMARLAQDDVFFDNAIDVMVRHLESHPDGGLTYANLQVMEEDGTPGKVNTPPEDPRKALAWRNLVGLCVMWRRSVWEKLGGFDPEFDTAEDYEYWCRVSRYFAMSKCPGGPLLWVRLHQEQGSQLFWNKQEILSNKIIRKLFPNDSPRNFLLRRRALSYVAYGAAMDNSYYNGRHLRAVFKILHSLVLWPLPFPKYGLVAPWARTKSLIVFLLRLLRMRPGDHILGRAGNTTTSGVA